MENLFGDLIGKFKNAVVLFQEKRSVQYGGMAFYLLLWFILSGGRTWAVLLAALGILMGRMSADSKN